MDIVKLEGKAKELAPSALGAEVEEQDIAKVIELWTGIPAARVQESELKKLADLESVLKSKVIGQDEAVEAGPPQPGTNQPAPPPGFVYLCRTDRCG